ncbi:vomeronasal type-2 receptor 26-like [Aquarana catesbeiana]|uniref:vomeronasal type-2 receptor 26-like n=1 Tax=Aquarana catesbeiana TaxID=8400 RepID=UPI003CCA5D93
MGVSYTYIFQFCVIMQCMTLWRSGMQSPACTLHFTDVFDEFQYFQDGDLIIGGVFTVRSKEDDQYSPEEKTYSPSFWYFVNLLAFLYAIDNINQDPDILPNITLGFHLFDSWLEPRKGVQSVLQILSGPNGTFPNYSCKGQGKLAGVIGDHYSPTTIPIAQILGLYRYTQISYGATDYSLSDRLLYPHVFRTVQNDYVYYLAIAKLVKHFGWNWVGILFSDNDTGENEVQILKRNLASQEICVAFEKRMTVNSATINQWKDTLIKVHSKVLILCGSFTSNARGYLYEYSQVNRNNMLILPPGWTSGEIKVITILTSFITSLSLQLFDPQILIEVRPFDDNLLSRHSQTGLLLENVIITFYNITSTQNGKNIYFQNFTISSQSFIRIFFPQIEGNMLCEESVRMYIGVKTMAEAIHFFNKFNHSFNINRFKQLYKYVKQIKNPYKTADRMTLFDENGEFPFHYKIVNQMNSYRQLRTSDTDVGSYTPWAKEEDQLHIDPDKITWNEGNNTKLESRCVDSCLPGYRKKPGSSIHSCCYDCVPCSEGQISNMTDSENCMNCPEEEWPNEKKDRCIPKHLEFLSYTDGISKVFLTVSAVLCIVTVLIKGIFITYLNTPIVKANNRNLSFVLLISILLSFLCVFLFLGQPLDITCILRLMTFGVIFSIAVSSLLAKTIMVYIAFKATKPGSYWRKWLGSKLANSIVSVCSSIQVIICIYWLSSSRPFKEMDTRSYQDKIIIQCNEGSVIGFYSVLGYMGFLAAVSFVLAFMVRTLPDSFNEAKYITFSMLVFCSVWISMIPAYLSTKGKYMVAVEIFAILASSAGLLSCIFFPKCFIILFKPELNTQSCLLDSKNRHE